VRRNGVHLHGRHNGYSLLDRHLHGRHRLFCPLSLSCNRPPDLLRDRRPPPRPTRAHRPAVVCRRHCRGEGLDLTTRRRDSHRRGRQYPGRVSARIDGRREANSPAAACRARLVGFLRSAAGRTGIACTHAHLEGVPSIHAAYHTAVTAAQSSVLNTREGYWEERHRNTSRDDDIPHGRECAPHTGSAPPHATASPAGFAARVRDAFLRFFVALLFRYREYLVYPPAPAPAALSAPAGGGGGGSGGPLRGAAVAAAPVTFFRADKFIADTRKDSTAVCRGEGHPQSTSGAHNWTTWLRVRKHWSPGGAWGCLGVRVFEFVRVCKAFCVRNITWVVAVYRDGMSRTQVAMSRRSNAS